MIRGRSPSRSGRAERYERFLEIVQAMKALDAYYPELPTHIARRFEGGQGIPEVQVEALFTKLLTSPAFAKTAKLIEKRLEERSNPSISGTTGSRASSCLKSFWTRWWRRSSQHRSLSEPHRRFFLPSASPRSRPLLSPEDRSRPGPWIRTCLGSRHAFRKSHLRTRVPAGGMNYKGFNIAMHELGQR